MYPIPQFKRYDAIDLKFITSQENKIHWNYWWGKVRKVSSSCGELCIKEMESGYK